MSILATRRSLGLQVAFSCLFCFMIMTDLVWSLFRATKRWATKRFQIRHEQPTQSTSSMGKSSDQAGCVLALAVFNITDPYGSDEPMKDRFREP